MSKREQITEKILSQALELHENGASFLSIIQTYPDYKEEIEELFEVLALTSDIKTNIHIPEAGLHTILEAMHSRPTASIPSPFITTWNVLRSSSWKYILPILAITLVTSGIVFKKAPSDLDSTPAQVQTASTQTTPKINPEAELAALPKPTGNIDDMMAVLSQEPSVERAIVVRTAANKETVTSDTGSVEPLLQKYGK